MLYRVIAIDHRLHLKEDTFNQKLGVRKNKKRTSRSAAGEGEGGEQKE